MNRNSSNIVEKLETLSPEQIVEVEDPSSSCAYAARIVPSHAQQPQPVRPHSTRSGITWKTTCTMPYEFGALYWCNFRSPVKLRSSNVRQL